MKGAGSIYFATLQGYVINETELYLMLNCISQKCCAKMQSMIAKLNASILLNNDKDKYNKYN